MWDPCDGGRPSRRVVKPALVVGETFFQALKQYVEFNDASSACLRAFRDTAVPHIPEIIDDFYAAIEAHPGASASITGGKAQIERLKETLRRWLDQLLLGPHDEAYYEMRARIGRMHVRIALPQAYMFTAMDRIRVRLLEVVRTAFPNDPERVRETSKALHQIMDLELAIMLETYREDLEAKNRTAERLSTIGEFAAGIGHELRNPLGVIESSLYLVRQRMAQQGISDEKLTKHLDKMSVEVQRSNRTINELLELARSRPPKLAVVDLAQVTNVALEGANIPAGVRVSVEAPEGFTLWADSDQFARVLANLFVNASQAMSGKGNIAVHGERVEGDVHVRVRDDGPGVPQEARSRIFEALFTTKARGTGLGLALCRRIMEAHGGVIALESDPRGACFRLTFPDADERRE